MMHAPNMTEDTVSRSNCNLRTHRRTRIKSTTPQSLGIETKHTANYPNAGQAGHTPYLKGAAYWNTRNRTPVRSPLKSP